MATLFDDITMGHLTLPNRIAMAPLTRNRADREGVPGPSAATYHAQRASAAVIITEGSQPSAAGQGFVRTPGLHSTEQLRAWRTVTDAVPAADGRIFAQIMHTGRIGHPDLVRHSSLPAGFVPLAPSAVRPTNGTAQTYARSGRPRAGTRPHRPRSSRRPAARRAHGRSAWSSAYRRRGRRYGDAISSSPDRCTFMFESIRRRNLDLLTWEVHLSSYQLPAAVTTCGFGSEGQPSKQRPLRPWSWWSADVPTATTAFSGRHPGLRGQCDRRSTLNLLWNGLSGLVVDHGRCH